MSDAGFAQKISFFLYQKGMGVAKPEFLLMTRFADPDWFKIAEVIMKDNNLDGRQIILDQILQEKILKTHPGRPKFLKMLGQMLSKGILDERREIVKFLDEHIELISMTDAPIYGPLMTAMRDSDTIIANTAESAVQKLKGEAP